MMRFNKFTLIFLIVLLLAACSQVSLKEKQLTGASSREYKIMLSVDDFNRGNEKKVVKQYFKALKKAVQLATVQHVNGKVKLASEMEVIFYDTPGSCMLMNIGYSFRERIKVKSRKSSVSLKYRNTDFNKVRLEGVDATASNAKSKLEADIMLNSRKQLIPIYSASTKYDNAQLIQNMVDINNAFPAFKSRYHFKDDAMIAPVNGLTAYERVYDGAWFDLDNTKAKISLSLWYQQIPLPDEKAILVEVSFSFNTGKEEPGVDSQAIIEQADKVFYAIQEMEAWSSERMNTKTQFVYQFAADFCDSK